MSKKGMGKGTGMSSFTLERGRDREPGQGQLSGVGGPKGVSHPADICYLFFFPVVQVGSFTA